MSDLDVCRAARLRQQGVPWRIIAMKLGRDPRDVLQAVTVWLGKVA